MWLGLLLLSGWVAPGVVASGPTAERCFGGDGEVAALSAAAVAFPDAAPSREYHSAVPFSQWDAGAGAMVHGAIVFGGRNASHAALGDALVLTLPAPAHGHGVSAPGAPSAEALVTVGGDAAPARFGHAAVWTGASAFRAPTHATARSFEGRRAGGDALFTAEGHPAAGGGAATDSARETVTGRLQGPSPGGQGSTWAPCAGGEAAHVLTVPAPCASAPQGCSCLALAVHSRAPGGAPDADDVYVGGVAAGASRWSGWRLRITAGAAAGYVGTVSLAAPGKYHTIPALPEDAMVDETSVFVLASPLPPRPPPVPPATMFVFGGRGPDGAVSDETWALATTPPPGAGEQQREASGVVAAADLRTSPATDDFTAGAAHWHGVPPGAAGVSVCGAHGHLLGGAARLSASAVVSKRYLVRRPHTALAVSATFVAIDAWRGYTAQLLVDGVEAWAHTFGAAPAPAAPNASALEAERLRLAGEWEARDAAWAAALAAHAANVSAWWAAYAAFNASLDASNASAAFAAPFPPAPVRGDNPEDFIPGARNVTAAPEGTPRPRVAGDECGDPEWGEEAAAVNVTVPHAGEEALLEFRVNVSGATWFAAPEDFSWGLAGLTLDALPSGPAWRRVNASGPPARAHAAAALSANLLVLFGGDASPAVAAPAWADEAEAGFANVSRGAAQGGGKLNDTWVFNTSGERWAQLHPQRSADGDALLVPPARSHASMVAGLGREVLLFGGQLADGAFTDELLLLDFAAPPPERGWLAAAPLGPSPGARAGHAAAVAGGRMWVFGGFAQHPRARTVRLVESLAFLHLPSLTWAAPPPAATPPHLVPPPRIRAPPGLSLGAGGPPPAPMYALAVAATADGELLVVPGTRLAGDPPAPAPGGSVTRVSVACAPDEPVALATPAALLTCGVAAAEVDALHAEEAKLRTQAHMRLVVLERQLTAAYFAAVQRLEQYAIDKEWFDGEVQRNTDTVAALVSQGKVYTNQVADLAQSRRDRAQVERRHVHRMQALEAQKLSLHVARDEARLLYDKALERLALQSAVLSRKQAEGGVCAGVHHACAVDAADRARCWGLNDAGQAAPPRGARFRAVACGDHFSCGILARGSEALRAGARGTGARDRAGDGEALCWGAASFGQTRVPAGQQRFRDLAAGASHVCAIRAPAEAAVSVDNGGALVCWGDDRDGQASPPAGADYVMVSAGFAHSCALRADSPRDRAARVGALVCWGRAADGRTAAPAGRFKWVAAGGRHSCAVAVGGRAVCWGSDAQGQARPPPELFSTVSAVSPPSPFLFGTRSVRGLCSLLRCPTRAGAAAADGARRQGHRHSCGVRANGGVACWGDGSKNQTRAPGKVRVAAVAAGWEHSCLIDALHHRVLCFGHVTPTARTPELADLATCPRVWVQ
jgi:hypothetical protein